MARRPARSATTGVIVAYKLGKAIVEVAAAAVLTAFARLGDVDRLRDVASDLHHHLVSVWSLKLAERIVGLASVNHMRLAALALALDAALSGIEGWALYRRFSWGPWLVVVATGSLLPFELREIVREVHLGRILLFVANATIVVYLVFRARGVVPHG